MQQKESERLPDDLPSESPLQKVVLKGIGMEVFLKREDLLLPAGGNKVRRFHAWLSNKEGAHTIAAMSDPGAHTFQVLQSFLDHPKYSNRIRRLLFLETLRTTNPYTQSIREAYLGDKRIKVISGSALLQVILLKFLAFIPGVNSMGIGGHLRLSPNPFSTALQEAQQQVVMRGFTGRRTHVFPIASGTMLDGFLTAQNEKNNDSFIGVMTGHPISRNYLIKKYSSDKSVMLIPYQPLIWNQYIKKAIEFQEQTGVWLDPVHTIHLLNALEHIQNKFSAGIVMWITCPLIKDNPSTIMR